MQVSATPNIETLKTRSDYPLPQESAARAPVRSISLGHGSQAVAAPIETARPVPPPSGVLDDTQVTTSYDSNAEVLVVTVATAKSGETIVEIPSAELRALAQRTRDALARQAQREG